MRKWVIDASPLIVLGKVDQIHLLSSLPDALAIPAPVAEETREGPNDDPARQWLLDAGSKFVRPSAIVAPEIAAWDLGRGERAALSWAYGDQTWTAFIDDLAARRCASALHIPFTGTVGVVLAAKHENYIPEVGSLLADLVDVGLRISEDVIAKARQLAGES